MNTTAHNPQIADSQGADRNRIQQETARRRTFAIISHPDAGKTTMTEKLLLYGGAIEEAGAVKARRSARAATSDWMELEKQRGISITSTVLQFQFENHCLNLLDTPGHQDFSEDTYRTLSAADNAVMLIDAAKGLEPQTRKLFEVCRMRRVPLFTFINKLDRPSREPLELLDEIEKEFSLPTYAVNWPIGSGPQFKGVVERQSRLVHLFERSVGGKTRSAVESYSLDDPAIEAALGSKAYEELIEELEILDEATASFDREKLERQELTPVYFGSAMNNFGVESFLRSFLELSVSPASFDSDSGLISPEHPEFTGVVFKLQANMDPKHRDRIAFVRVCSGMFEKDMTVKNSRTGKEIMLSQPKKLFARERESVEEAYPGDIIGLSNPGCFAIGDTISSTGGVKFASILSFAPEIFAVLENREPSKYKQFHKGISALQEEGAVQILWLSRGETRYPVLAAVGSLQFDVVQFRLKSEYGVSTELRHLPNRTARWTTADWKTVESLSGRGFGVATDQFQDPVLLFESEFEARWFKDKNQSIELLEVSPRTRKFEPED